VTEPTTIEPAPRVVVSEPPVKYSPVTGRPTYKGAVPASAKLDAALTGAKFRQVDRSADNRTISISVPKF
jgi:hypothetical protein